jgi:hypothetical protein
MAKIFYIKVNQFHLTKYNILLKLKLLSHGLFFKSQTEKQSTLEVVVAL